MSSRSVSIAVSLALALACSHDDAAQGTHTGAALAVRVRDPSQPLPDIVLVSIDSLRYDHLGCYGYAKPTSPAIDELAKEGVTCDLAVSTTSWTLPAHAALFTGQVDATHGVVDNGLRLADSRTTLAEVLREAGYTTAGFFGGPYLHPIYGLSQGFERWESCMSASARSTTDAVVEEILATRDAGSHADVTGPRTAAAVRRWLEGLDELQKLEDGEPGARGARARRPRFVFLHLWDVHHDYIPPTEFAREFDPDYAGSLDVRDLMHNDAISGIMPARDLQHLVAMYDGEIRFTDDVLRKILEDLELHARTPNTLVVVVSDHGEEFFEHGGKGHQRTLHREVVRIPIVFHWRGHLAAGARVSELVRLVDVMPTVLSLAGIEAPRLGEGRDVAQLLRGGTLAPAPALLQLSIDGRSMHALCQGEREVVREGGATPYNGLHWIGDGEGDGAARSLADELGALERELEVSRGWVKKLGTGAEPIRVDADVARRLKDLGYTHGEADGPR